LFWVKNTGFVLVKAVSHHGSDDMSHSIDGATMAGVVNIENSHQNIVDGFDDSSFLEHDFVVVVHEFIFHVFADSGNELEAFLIEVFEVFADISLITKALSLNEFKEFIQHFFGIVHDIGSRNRKARYFA
jgi:hypothetical protein